VFLLVIKKDMRGVVRVESKERQEHIVKRAYQLADSGAHISVITIVSTLVAGGYAEAVELFQNSVARDELNKICAARWAYANSAPAEKAAVAMLPLLLSEQPEAECDARMAEASRSLSSDE
jgi:hypothetical protein